MFGNYYYHQRIRKAVATFGAMFNDIYVLRKDSGGGVISTVKVPLSYGPRAKFLDSLLEVVNNKKYDESTRFTLTYRLLKGASRFRFFQPCFKHYLLDHVKSRFAQVPAPEWEIATFLPTASWKKASAGRVYSDSRKMASV